MLRGFAVRQREWIDERSKVKNQSSCPNSNESAAARSSNTAAGIVEADPKWSLKKLAHATTRYETIVSS